MNTPNGSRSNNLKASKYLIELVKSYVDDEKVRADIVESYHQKKPKSYAQVFNGLFRFSKITLMFFHGLSFLIATPLIFSLTFQLLMRRDQSEIKGLFDNVLQDFGAVFTPLFFIPAAITLIILFLLEYGQHVTLNSLFNIYFQWGKKIIPGLAFLALIFSAASVLTSGLGAKELVHVSKAPNQAVVQDLDKQLADALDLRNKHSDRSNSIIKQRDEEIEFLRGQKKKYLEGNEGVIHKYGQIMMGISLFFELMIITNTFNIHNYQFKTARETEMVNDMIHGQSNSLPLAEYKTPTRSVAGPTIPRELTMQPKKLNGQHH